MPRFERKIGGTPDRTGINPFTKQKLVIPGRPAKRDVWEIEQRGTVLEIAKGKHGEELRRSKRSFDTEEEAFAELALLVRKQRRRGFVEVGASEVVTEGAEKPPSALWLDEAFPAGDERFVGELVRFAAPGKLAALAEPWFADTRPWARSALLAYIDDGCDRLGHKPLVKRLFKRAEGAEDDELMAHFLVAFDRLSHRVLGPARRVWDPSSQSMTRKRRVLPDPSVDVRLGEGERSVRFTRATRQYLVRRAFRYFRKLGHRDPGRYGRAIRLALALYRDEHLRTPMQLLDAWGMMHALYAGSDAIVWNVNGLVVAKGHTLAELRPSPKFPQAWQGVFDGVLDLLVTAQSRTVRVAALKILREQYPSELAALDIGQLRRLLLHAADDVQELGAELLRTAKGADKLRVGDWLAMLEIRSPTVLALVCEAIERHVAPTRLTLDQAVELARAKAAPVARLGMTWLKDKPIRSGADLDKLVTLASARVPTVREEAVALIAQKIRDAGAGGIAKPEHVRELFDAPHIEPRRAGLRLLDEVPHLGAASELWWALTESPWPDVQSFAVARASAWLTDRGQAGASAERDATARHLWATLVVAVNRGSIAKRRALRQIADHIARDPGRAVSLVPLFAVALRSVRAAERSAALGAVARAAYRAPSLRASLREHVPELVVSEQVSS